MESTPRLLFWGFNYTETCKLDLAKLALKGDLEALNFFR